jgi:hypothetical protein
VSWLATGMLAGIVALGCTREASRPPTLETAASSGTGVRTTDSTPPAVDTVVPVPVPDTPAKPVARKPVGHPVPKPRTPPIPASTISASAPAPAAPAAASAATAPTTAPATATAAADEWLSYDAATNTVTFELIAGPFTFNGYRNGEGTLVVPSQAKMVINFVNKDGTPHSAILISGEGPIPNAASEPAIPRAYTNKVLEGLPQEAGDAMRFPVPESGSYRIFCGVPGHGLSGMWIWLKVDSNAKAPSFGPTKG